VQAAGTLQSHEQRNTALIWQARLGQPRGRRTGVDLWKAGQAAKVTPTARFAGRKDRVRLPRPIRPLRGDVAEDGTSRARKRNVHAMLVPGAYPKGPVRRGAGFKSDLITQLNGSLDRSCSRWNRAARSGKVNADSKRSRRCLMLSTDIAPAFYRSNKGNLPATSTTDISWARTVSGNKEADKPNATAARSEGPAVRISIRNCRNNFVGFD